MRKSLILSVLDQAMLSAFNFVLALILIRYWSNEPEVFGIYAVILAGSLSAMSVQNALVISHLTVMRPSVRNEEDENALLSVFWSANVVTIAAAMAITFLGALVGLAGSDPGLALSAALYTGGMLLREYTRSYHFTSLKITSVMVVDAISLALSTVAIAAGWLFWPPLSLNVLFLILAVSQAAASLPVILSHRAHFQLSFSTGARATYLTVWREQSRWALIGVMATEFQQRGYVYVVAAVFGPAQVALLQAVALLFRPVQLLIHAWGKLARVILAGHFAAGRYSEARAFSMKSLTILAVVFFAFLCMLWLAWPLIKAHLFKGQFADSDGLVVLWSAATGVIIVTGIFSVEAQSLIKFRELSYGAILGAIACGLTLVPVALIGDPRGAVLAVISGQLVLMYCICRILIDSYRSVEGQGGIAPEAARS
jgi:O-antigen/teichoic acid export membrane protein